MTYVPGSTVWHAAGDRGDDVLGVRVDEGVDRVESQPVHVEVAHPLLGGLEDPLAHRVGLRVVEVDRPPRAYSYFPVK